MRVLLICLQSLKRHELPAYEFWRQYFREGIAEAGMSVAEVPGVDWAEALISPAGPVLNSWRDRTWERATQWIKGEHGRQPFDLFLSYLYPEQVDTGAIEHIRRLGIPTVNFFCDNVRQFRRVPDAFRPFDLHWVPEYEALDMYRSAGLRHLHAPMPSWVPPGARTWDHQETEPPTFIGSADVLRRRLLAEAIGLGADVRIYGRGWTNEATHESAPAVAVGTDRRSNAVANQLRFVRQEGVPAWIRKIRARARQETPVSLAGERIGGSVSSDAYIRLTQQAVVTIGINRVPSFRHAEQRPMVYSRLRDLEAPMLGACYLTEWTEGLTHLYELGTEIETYRSPGELADKVRSLSADAPKRRHMRRAAQQRALTDHSIATTLRRIVSAVQ